MIRMTSRGFHAGKNFLTRLLAARFLSHPPRMSSSVRWAKIAKRAKDTEDVRDVIAVQGDEVLDWDYIHHWCKAHGTRELLDSIRASIPPID